LRLKRKKAKYMRLVHDLRENLKEFLKYNFQNNLILKDKIKKKTK